MEYENGQVSGDLIVERDLTLNGMVTGNILVKSGICLTLNGMCLGELTLEEKSEADVSGIVQGNINNNGGILRVNGVVQGNVTDAGNTTISDGAIIQGEIKKVSTSTTSIIAATVGGAIIANMIIPGVGSAVVGGILGALLGSESSSKEKKGD